MITKVLVIFMYILFLLISFENDMYDLKID